MKSSSFQIILLVIFGSLFVSGVVIFALTSATGGSSGVGAVTIWGTLDDEAFNQIVRAKADADNKMAAVVYQQKDADTFQEGLTEALARGQGPDMFVMTQAYAMRDAGKTAHIPYDTMSPSQFSGTFVEASKPFLTGDGVVAIPLLADPLVLYWNRDLMNSAGITVPPGYWDELPELSKVLTKKSDDGRIIKSAISIGTFDNIENAKDILSTLIMQSGNPITQVSDTGMLLPALAQQGGSAALAVTNALLFYTQFADPSKEEYTWNGSFPSARGAFARGDVAIYLGHASERPAIARLNPNLNFSISQMLQYRTQPALNTATIYALAVPRTAKNKYGAATVSYILAGPELAQQLADAYSMTPALKALVSVSNTPKTSDGSLSDVLGNSPKTQRELLNKSTAMSRSWIDPDPRRTTELFRGMIEDIVSGTQSVNAAVGRLNASLKEIIGL